MAERAVALCAQQLAKFWPSAADADAIPASPDLMASEMMVLGHARLSWHERVALLLSGRIGLHIRLRTDKTLPHRTAVLTAALNVLPPAWLK